LANDAICKEADFPGRDEWNLSLFDDETLVNMQSYTMLTTLVMYSPPDKYIPKMIGLLEKASSPTIRTAALHNLVVSLGREPSPDLERQIVESMLPWLEDPKWATNATWMGDARVQLVQKLSNYKIPESVPGLLKVLDESRTETRFVPNGLPANVTVNAMRASNSSVNAAALAANAMASAANAIVKGSEREVISYPYRSAAINALAKQQDGRAVRALRRVLQEVEGYERSTVVNAIFACGGFSIPEQIEGLETAIKSGNEAMNVAPANVSLSQVYARRLGNMPNPGVVASGAEIRDLLGQQIMNSPEITDALAQAIVERIDALAGKDDSLAQSYRSLILKWHNAVFNVLLLHDLKRDAADVDTIIRLLSDRKELREKQGTDVLDLQTGKPVAVGIAQCLLEDPHGYEAMLETGDVESRTAMLACARMIRAPLPVAKVAENLKSPSQTLQIAVERYLESEDSPEARALVLARHPNEAKILGATSAFYVEGMSEENENSYLWMLYQSLGDSSLYNGWSGSSNDDELQTIEKNLQTEVKKDDNLVGVYAYDKNYIRIYKDRAVISWDEDESRYRERPLTQEEFDGIKSYLATNKVDDLPPFLTCGGDYCTAKELVMLGRNGGRRVYMNSGGTGTAARMVSEFFAGLDKYFADLKLTHATLKYGLSREIPGLEIILASDELHAETVWKNGSDLRVAASLSSVRQQVKKDIDKAVDAAEAKDSLTDEEAGPDELKASLAEQRAYEGFGWHKVVKGDDGGPAVQPPGVDFIPGKDSYPVHATDEQWKARAAGLEVRGGDKGLYLISGGRATILQKGNFAKPVVSSNGRWAVAPQLDAEPGSQLVRVNLATRTVFPVKTGDYQPREPAAFVLILNKFLLVPQNGYDDSGDYAADHDNGPDDTVAEDDDPDSMLLLDAETGDVLKAKNEFRPLSQQTFRPLQKASKPDEYWAALPGTEKNETQLGIYNARWLTFKPVLLIPKIKFNSMSMWVDETEGKVYFVYRGHLLALPLRSQPPRVSGRSDR
jgi:HEAT repeat protein